MFCTVKDTNTCGKSKKLGVAGTLVYFKTTDANGNRKKVAHKIEDRNLRFSCWPCEEADYEEYEEYQAFQKQNLFKESIAENGMIYYPNPLNNTLNVVFNDQLPSEKIITITNSIGEQVYVYNSNASNLTVDISKLNNGIYFIKATHPTQGVLVNPIKVVVQH